jgi:hypothetical protein
LLDLGTEFTPCVFPEISLTLYLVFLQLQLHAVVPQNVGRVTVLSLPPQLVRLNNIVSTSASLVCLVSLSKFATLS